MIAGSRNAQRAWIAATCAAALLTFVAACGDSEPEPAARPAAPESPAAAVRPPKPAKSPPARAAAPSADQLGDTERGEGTVPDGFPEDLPLPASARPERWMKATGPGAIVAFEADSPPGDVFAHFEQSLPGAGWTIDTKRSGEGHWMLVASKGQRKARISIAAGGAGSQFGVAVSGP